MKSKLKNILSLTVSIAVLGIIGFVNYSSRETNPDNKQKSQSAKIISPLKGVNIEYANYKVNAQKQTTLVYPTGSKIIIPSNAFLDKNKKPITGTVELKYREFHTPTEFFLSGIPMNYDSAGVSYQFESAGMLEILAFQNNEQLFANPNSKITIEMASKQVADKYNIYQYDTIAGKWNFMYKDKAGLKSITKDMSIENKNNLLEPIKAEVLPEKILKPVLADKDKFQFDIDVDQKEFPEVAVYKGVLFEVADQTDSVKKNCKNLWTDINISSTENDGIYLISLSNGFTTCSFNASPVLKEQDYAEAFSKYTDLLDKRKQKEKVIKKTNDSLRSLYLNEQASQADFYRTMQKNALQTLNTQLVIQRTFILSGFGIWNSDCPSVLPKGEQFAATYVDSLGNVLRFNTLYLVERGRNAMFSISGYSRLYYDPTKENLLWAVTNDNKIALFREKKFKDIKIKNDQATLEMELIDKQITKAYEVKSIIDI